MIVKWLCCASVLCLLNLANGASVNATNWTAVGDDNKWTAQGNWDAGIPTGADDAWFDKSAKTALIDSSVSAVCSRGAVGNQKGANGACRLEITGGTFVIKDKALHLGRYAGSEGILVMSAGVLDIQGMTAGAGDLNVGYAGRGTLSVNGGRIDVKDDLIIPADAAGVGRLNLHGGTISCGRFSMRPVSGGVGTMDITRGTLIVNGDAASTVKSYTANGWMTAYNGNGTVNVDYNATNPGKTTVTAVSNDAADGAGDQFFTMANGNVKITYNLTKGWADFHWSNTKKISHFYSAVKLPAYVTSKDYPTRTHATNGAETIVTCSGGGFPTMRQHFSLIGTDSFLVQVEMQGTNLSTNWMAPIQAAAAGAIDLGVAGDNRILRVPFCNSEHERYRALPMDSTDAGYEVAALYDNTSRNGLVVGSVTHDTWKTGVDFSGSSNKVDFLCVYGGASQNKDVMPHGNVTGDTIFSPKVYVGFHADWREGMDSFADANLAVAPKLALPAPNNNGVPLGWKHFGPLNLGSKITYAKACLVSDFIKNSLQNHNYYNDQNTVYICLDAGAEMHFTDQELADWVAHCHANGQKAGSYFTPFKVGGGPDKDLDTAAPGTNYTWREIALKDAGGNPITDGARYALDPTHPGTKQMIASTIRRWKSIGLDYFRMGFVNLGALEGGHYDKGKTGMAAYNEGMGYVVDQNAGAMQINLAISPVFPYQYAHSRRISCDVNYKITDTEYQLNSSAHDGWWLSRLYSFNDPGNVSYEPSGNANVAKSRTIAAAICSGQISNANDLTQADHQALAKANLTKPGVMDVARLGQCFRSVENNTGSFAPDSYVLAHGGLFYIAMFNFGASSVSKSVDLSRAGLSGGTMYNVTDLWTGGAFRAKGTLSSTLAGYEANLFKLEPAAGNPSSAPSAPTAAP